MALARFLAHVERILGKPVQHVVMGIDHVFRPGQHDRDGPGLSAGLAAAHGGLSQLSMGMSEDFAVAVQEGATLVRVGRRIVAPSMG